MNHNYVPSWTNNIVSNLIAAGFDEVSVVHSQQSQSAYVYVDIEYKKYKIRVSDHAVPNLSRNSSDFHVGKYKEALHWTGLVVELCAIANIMTPRVVESIYEGVESLDAYGVSRRVKQNLHNHLAGLFPSAFIINSISKMEAELERRDKYGFKLSGKKRAQVVKRLAKAYIVMYQKIEGCLYE